MLLRILKSDYHPLAILAVIAGPVFAGLAIWRWWPKSMIAVTIVVMVIGVGGLFVIANRKKGGD